MEIIYLILSYKRPVALSECVRTVFTNTKVRPDMVYILDDNSGAEQEAGLFNFRSQLMGQNIPCTLVLNGGNRGIGNQFAQVYDIINRANPKIAVIIEGDYFMRNEWMEDVLDTFEKLPYSTNISLMDHADMRLPEKYNGTFKNLMVEYLGEDIKARPYMYNHQNPHVIETSRGPLEYFGITNFCGAQVLHWERINKFFFDWLGDKETYWRVMNRAFQGPVADDGRMSCLHSKLWEEYAVKEGLDITKVFGCINILPSLAFHAASQGYNGKLDPNYFPDGSSFPGVNSGTFPEDYNNWTRKK